MGESITPNCSSLEHSCISQVNRDDFVILNLIVNIYLELCQSFDSIFNPFRNLVMSKFEKVRGDVNISMIIPLKFLKLTFYALGLTLVLLIKTIIPLLVFSAVGVKERFFLSFKFSDSCFNHWLQFFCNKLSQVFKFFYLRIKLLRIFRILDASVRITFER